MRTPQEPGAFQAGAQNANALLLSDPVVPGGVTVAAGEESRASGSWVKLVCHAWGDTGPQAAEPGLLRMTGGARPRADGRGRCRAARRAQLVPCRLCPEPASSAGLCSPDPKPDDGSGNGISASGHKAIWWGEGETALGVLVFLAVNPSSYGLFFCF